MTYQSVRNLIAKSLGVDVAEVTDNANIQSDLGADSLDIVELVMDIEGETDINIPDEQTTELTTVGALLAYLQSQGLEDKDAI